MEGYIYIYIYIYIYMFYSIWIYIYIFYFPFSSLPPNADVYPHGPPPNPWDETQHGRFLHAFPPSVHHGPKQQHGRIFFPHPQRSFPPLGPYPSARLVLAAPQGVQWKSCGWTACFLLRNAATWPRQVELLAIFINGSPVGGTGYHRQPFGDGHDQSRNRPSSEEAGSIAALCLLLQHTLQILRLWMLLTHHQFPTVIAALPKVGTHFAAFLYFYID